MSTAIAIKESILTHDVVIIGGLKKDIPNCLSDNCNIHHFPKPTKSSVINNLQKRLPTNADVIVLLGYVDHATGDMAKRFSKIHNIPRLIGVDGWSRTIEYAKGRKDLRWFVDFFENYHFKSNELKVGGESGLLDQYMQKQLSNLLAENKQLKEEVAQLRQKARRVDHLEEKYLEELEEREKLTKESDELLEVIEELETKVNEAPDHITDNGEQIIKTVIEQLENLIEFDETKQSSTREELPSDELKPKKKRRYQLSAEQESKFPAGVRKLRKWTREKFDSNRAAALYLGIPIGTFGNLLTGNLIPNSESIKTISEKTGISQRELRWKPRKGFIILDNYDVGKIIHYQREKRMRYASIDDELGLAIGTAQRAVGGKEITLASAKKLLEAIGSSKAEALELDKQIKPVKSDNWRADLKDWITKNKLTYQEFGKMICLTGGHVSNIVNGHNIPSIESIERIKHVTNNEVIPAQPKTKRFKALPERVTEGMRVLREYLLRKGMLNKELAARINASTIQVSKLLSGWNLKNRNELIHKIAKETGIAKEVLNRG